MEGCSVRGCFSELTLSVALLTSPLRRTRGGVARRTGPPVCWGTCSDSLCGRLVLSFWRCVSAGSTCALWSIGCVVSAGGRTVGCGEPFVWLGSAGKVPKAPSCTLRFAGGLPLGLLPGAFADGHALDTVGPLRRRLRGLEEGVRFSAASRAASMWSPIEPEPGWAVIG